MKLTAANVGSFARWSGDNNPLHVDNTYAGRTFFGRPVAHGAFCIIEAMRHVPFDVSPTALEIEFRHGLFPGDEINVENDGRLCRVRRRNEIALTIRDASESVLKKRDSRGTYSSSWDIDRGAQSCIRTSPREWDVAELTKHVSVHGRYPVKAIPPKFLRESCLSSLQIHLLGLCSYLVGMELPGKHSLFTGLKIHFLRESFEAPNVDFRLQVVRFLPELRMLDLQLNVMDSDGQPLATAEISAYVPFSPSTVNVDAMAVWLEQHRSALRGQVALICGGSRGLGADLVAGLALCGCQVYVASRTESVELQDLARNLEDYETGFTQLLGDISDPDWCAEIGECVLADHGRLTHLVLNACSPPPILAVGPETAELQSNYVSENLRLVQTPMAHFADKVDNESGVVVAVSSSYVQSAPRDLSHYVVLKQAVEGFIQACARQFGRTAYIMPRPPKLQTTWNDTPTGVAGAIPSHCAALGIVGQILDRPTSGEAKVLEDFPSERDILSSIRDGGKPRLSIALCGTFTLDTLVDPLRFWFDQVGFKVDVEIAGYGQTLQELVNPSSLVGRNQKGANLIVLRARDWLRERGNNAEDVADTRDYLISMAQEFCRALVTHRQHAASGTVLLLCPSELSEPTSLDECVAETEAMLVSRTAGIAGLTVVRAENFESSYGAASTQRYDRLRDEIAHIPFKDTYLNVLAAIAVRHMYRPYLPMRKVVAVDCDNTLWHGVVGEDGWDGITLEPHHLALQRFLVDLSQRGILICLCSKNVESDVWEVFEKRLDLPLRPEHIVASAINWQPKSQNLRTLASRLNLGLDSFCFLDDNPVECAEVRAGCSAVLTLEWPKDMAKAQSLLTHLWEFDITEATEEDHKRTRMYRDEYARKEVQEEALSFEEFIAGLGLEIVVEEVSQEALPRASQMTMRTNQFNFTTVRRSESEVKRLVDSPDYECRIIRVSDRFGDYGIVGLIFVKLSAGRAVVDTFLMSCRVLGRGVEQRMAVELGMLAKASGYERVELRLVTTKKNLPAQQFLQSICPEDGLEITNDGISSEIDVENLIAVEFNPATSPAIAETQVSNGTGQTSLGSAEVREREEQIKRAAYEFGNIAEWSRIGDSSDALAEPVQLASIPSQTFAEVKSVVVDTFADTLRRTADEIIEIDELDQLECDSLKIVAITVALSDVFPWLPSTLLFEHARVSAIAQAIADLSKETQHDIADTRSSAHDRNWRDDSPDLAVVGMGVRCAGADSPETLWQLLKNGGSAVRPVPPERDYFFGRLEDDRPHWAGLLDAVDHFDGDFFSAPPREAQWLDPQLRLFMETAWTALEDAGHTDRVTNGATGVFVGVMYDDYAVTANRLATRTGNPMRSWEGFSLANRFSQFMGFHGPSLAVETACSSSATALHQARLALLHGDCDAAVVGGVNLILDPNRLVQLGRLGILSPDGQCRPFGDAANGTVMGEGVGVVVVKRSQDALDAGDHIYGLIKGTGVSAGAGSVGFTAPNPVAQAEAARRCLQAARVDPRTISYVEAHGTGTDLGDPIEVRGLAMAYEDRRLWDSDFELQMHCSLGSIKPNIGHLEAGAGVLGLIKVLLQLYHGQRVPSLTSEASNPQIDFRNGAFSVQRKLSPWLPVEVPATSGGARTVPRRAAINSFGVGGSNVHIIAEEAPATSDHDVPDLKRRNHLVMISADRAVALAPQARALRAHLESHANLDLGDVTHSLAICKSQLEHRLALIVKNREELLQSLEAIGQGELKSAQRGRARQREAPEQIAFLFTGQGSQYIGMGRELYDTEPVFRNAIDDCNELFDSELDVSLLDILFAEEDSEHVELINETRYTQPALFGLQFALAQLWISWGIKPDVVVGHSIGEFAAMCIAGGLTLEDAARLVAERGRLMQALPEGGAMLAISADESVALEVIHPFRAEVSVAAMNAPGQVVVSGAGSAIAEIAESLQCQDVDVTRLTVSHAFHSPLMEPMLDEFRAVASSVTHASSRVAFLSAVDGTFKETTDADYWVDQIRKPVRFMDAMKVAAEREITTFIEIGPHPVLLGMGKSSIPQSQATWVASLRRGKDASHTLLSGLGQYVANGGSVDWRAFDAPFERRRVPLPAYVFSRKPHWLDASAAQETDLGIHINALKHPPADGAYQLEWREAPLPAARTPESEGWFVLGCSDVASGLSVALAVAGCKCEFIETSCAETAVIQLEKALTRNGVSNVVYVSPPDGPVDRWVETGLALFSNVSRLIMKAASPASLWAITHDAVATGRDAADVPYQLGHAAIWGYARVFALEAPSRWRGLIDVASRVAAGEAADCIVAELLAETDEDQVAYRSGARLIPRLVPRSMPLGNVQLSPEASYLITGGTGSLGMRCARWLALRGARYLVLCSRRGEEAEGVSELLDELARYGVKAVAIAADMTRSADVQRVLDAATRSGHVLRGVVHAAGLDEPTSIDAMTVATLRRAFDAKVLGAYWLHEKTRDFELDFFALFSSMSAVLGSAKRAPYAAANAALDLLAHERGRLGLPALSIDWGPWAGGGMASEEELESYSRAGNRGLESDVALMQLGALLDDGTTQALIVDIDWARFAPIYEAKRPRNLISEIGSALLPTDARSENESGYILNDLEGLSNEERRQRIRENLASKVQETLQRDSSEDIDVEENFFEMGMDSLMTVEFVTQIETEFQIKDPALIVDHPTISLLAEKIAVHLEGRLRTDSPVESRSKVSSMDPDTEGQQSSTDLPSSDGVVTYRAELDSAIDTFQREAWPERGSFAAAKWRWMFLQSAARLDAEAQMWFFQDNGAIVGETGAIQIDLEVCGDRHRGAWLVDSMVLEEFREKAVGTRLVLQAVKDTPIALSLGQEEYMRQILLQSGWKQVSTLEHMVYPLRPQAVLKGKFGSAMAWLGGLGLDISMQIKRRLSRPARRWETTVTEVDRFGTEHDQLWKRVCGESQCAGVRDASFLNWKYIDRPHSNYTALNVHRDNELIGAAVLTFRESDDTYRYRRALLLDVIVPTSDRASIWAILDAVAQKSLDKDVDAIQTHVSSTELVRELLSFGYIRRSGRRHLLVYLSGNVDEKTAAAIMTSDRWWLTMADSDMDGGI